MSAVASSGVSFGFNLLTNVLDLVTACSLGTAAFFPRRALPPVFRLVADFRGRRSIFAAAAVSTPGRFVIWQFR